MRATIPPVILFILFLFMISSRSFGQSENPDVVFKVAQKSWVDSVMNSMSFEERVGQLFMLPAYSNRGASHREEITRMINDYHIGGLIMMQGGPVRQANLTNHFQRNSHVPLLIAMDAEWGLDMRLDSVPKLPRQLLLGAVQDPQLVYDYGELVARQLTRLGVHINFAPVVDVNNNPDNPVINDRAFGENRYNVTLRGLQYMKGLQNNGVIACAKHFPGHGDTDVDSHKDLPVINHDRARLYSIEMWPFRIMIEQGVMSIMVAHLFIPALDAAENTPTTLSKKVVTNVLKEELNFEGLVITDALNMQGAAGFSNPATVAYKALLAGNDILLFPEDIPGILEKINAGIKNGEISRKEIDRRVRKILQAKFWAGLNYYHPISTENLYKDLNNTASEGLHFNLVKDALTLAKNKDGLIPFRSMDENLYAAVAIGTASENEFQKTLQNYSPVSAFQVGKNAPAAAFNLIFDQVKKEPVVIISIHDMSRYSSNGYGLTNQTKNFIKLLKDQTKVVLVVFGTPYSLSTFNDLDNVVVAYVDNNYSQALAAQLLFGGTYARGQLPVSVSSNFQFGTGEIINYPIRMGYSVPEAVGIDSEVLKNIDKIAHEAMNMKATPGMQVLAAKDGYIIYEKSFGYHTYDKEQPVRWDDIYDIASITKIAASTISLMYLYDQGQFDLDKDLVTYLPELEGSQLANLNMMEILNHTAGLEAWIPFFVNTLTTGSLYQSYYCYESDDFFCMTVANEIYMRSDYVDSIYKIISQSTIKDRGEYRYSDLGFYLYPKIIEKLTGLTIDQFVDSVFFRPMNLEIITYNPLEKNFPLNRIMPTEYDKAFRQQVIHGYVHDQGAAMLGGVSGHAGLFSNARDLATIMQMLLNGGNYGGEHYIDESTIRLFTQRHSEESRRGLGFDKPVEDTTKNGPTAKSASQRTFGHSGFTGTCTWADPETGILYVFLSNRVHPDADNKKLAREDIRTRIHQVLYDAIIKTGPEKPLAEKE